jgi:hypothetical protein
MPKTSGGSVRLECGLARMLDGLGGMAVVRQHDRHGAPVAHGALLFGRLRAQGRSPRGRATDVMIAATALTLEFPWSPGTLTASSGSASNYCSVKSAWPRCAAGSAPFLHTAIRHWTECVLRNVVRQVFAIRVARYRRARSIEGAAMSTSAGRRETKRAQALLRSGRQAFGFGLRT